MRRQKRCSLEQPSCQDTIEDLWSIFKRGVAGTFHKTSRKYMPLYIAGFQFRYNNREKPDIFGEAIRGC